jgi:hypothetical protein
MPEDINNQAAPLASTPTPAASQEPVSRPADAVGLRVSLIPAEEMERNDPRKGFRLFLIAVGVFVLILGLVVGFLGYTVNTNIKTVAQLKVQTDDAKKQSDEIAPSVVEAKNAQTRLKALSTLLSEHKTGLKIFAFLESNTLPDVSYSSISAGTDGTVNLTVSAGTFEAYAAQVGELSARPEVKGLSTSSITPSYDADNKLLRVDFSMTLKMDPALFLSQAPSPSN